MDPLTRLAVDDWEVLRVEQRGAAAKNWLLESGCAQEDPRAHWLFKPAHVHVNGTRQVGDWTEVIASLIAAALEVPCAESRLATRLNLEGVLVRNVRPSGMEMHSGALALLDRGIVLRREERDGPATLGHTLANIHRALEGMSAPQSAPSWATCDAFDVYVGYLILDALVANGDRHEENWSILRGPVSTSDALAPSYDMENSLGFQLTDDDRERHLALDDCRTYAQNGFAKRLDGDRRNTLVNVAARATADASRPGRARLGRLVDEVSHLDFDEIVPRSDAVSEVTRRFAVSLLTINARRIADGIDNSR